MPPAQATETHDSLRAAHLEEKPTRSVADGIPTQSVGTS
jgi:hypothetical protein